METVLTLLLVRFGIIAGIVVAAALVVFAAAVALKRRGRLGAAREKAAPLVRGAARMMDDRASGGRGAIGGAVLGAAARYLDDRGRTGDRR